MSLLIRGPLFSRREDFTGACLSTSQIQIDSRVAHFSDQATDVASVTAMVGGQFAFRFARYTLTAASSSFLASANPTFSILTKTTSYAGAFATEAFTFTGIQRTFHPSENNFSRDFLHSSLSLASLKFFAGCGAAPNSMLQHLTSDLAIVASHQVAALVGMEEKSQQSLAAQLFEAEAMIWQMKVGMRLLHFTLPSLASMERSLEHSTRFIQISSASRTLKGASNEKGALFSSPPLRVELRRRLTAGIIDRLTRTEGSECSANDPAMLTFRERCLASLPASVRNLIATSGPRLGFVFLTGMYNPPPDPSWMNFISSAFGKGAVVISTAPGANCVKRQGFYSIVGENRRVLQHYQMESALVIRRLAFALRDASLLGNAEELILLGHSKGGILVHGLKAIHKAYVMNGSRIPTSFQRLYPGLADIPPEDLSLVMNILGRSFYGALDWPIEGIPYPLFVRAADYILLEGVAQGFETEHIDEYVKATELHPSEMDLVLHSRMPGLLDSLRDNTHPGNRREALAYKTTTVFFHGTAFAMGAREGDGMLKKPHRYPSQALNGRFNHLDVIVSPLAAAEILSLTFMKYEQSVHRRRSAWLRHQ